jgi:predicted Fe-S protein YdhL (DUF1289 family)
MAEPQSPPPPVRRVMSPCKGICIMDAKTSLCVGCKRTIDEIARWPMIEDPERQKIVDSLKTRKL